MEALPEPEFILYRQRTVQWQRLGREVVSLYFDSHGANGWVVVEELDNQSYWAVEVGDRNPDNVWHNPYDHQ